MPDLDQNANPEKEESSLLDSADKNPEESLMDSAGKDDKEAQEAEEKRILEADESTLSDEDKNKKAELVKTREEERLLSAKDEELSDEDKAKKQALVKEKDAQAKANEVPEKYEIKTPEGMTVNQALLDKISPFLKEKKISQADAQKLADLYIETITAQSQAQDKEFKQFRANSRKETMEALGPDADKELSYLARVRDTFFSEETRYLLNASGLADNKALTLDLIKIGKLISEDKLVKGKSQKPGSSSPEDVLYPEQGKQK